MKFDLSQKQIKFFSNLGFIEFENILTSNDFSQIKKEIKKVLSERD